MEKPKITQHLGTNVIRSWTFLNRPTLFPYTTLFRSVRLVGPGHPGSEPAHVRIAPASDASQGSLGGSAVAKAKEEPRGMSVAETGAERVGNVHEHITFVPEHCVISLCHPGTSGRDSSK